MEDLLRRNCNYCSSKNSMFFGKVWIFNDLQQQVQVGFWKCCYCGYDERESWKVDGIVFVERDS